MPACVREVRALVGVSYYARFHKVVAEYGAGMVRSPRKAWEKEAPCGGDSVMSRWEVVGLNTKTQGAYRGEENLFTKVSRSMS